MKKEEGQGGNQEGIDRNCWCATKEDTRDKKEDVTARDLKGDPSKGLLLPTSLYTSLNSVLEHCSLEGEESQASHHHI